MYLGVHFNIQVTDKAEIKCKKVQARRSIRCLMSSYRITKLETRKIQIHKTIEINLLYESESWQMIKKIKRSRRYRNGCKNIKPRRNHESKGEKKNMERSKLKMLNQTTNTPWTC